MAHGIGRGRGRSTSWRGTRQANRRSRPDTRQLKPVVHKSSFCGNPGCMKCTPIIFTPFLNKKGEPINMRPWMYKKWKESHV